MKIISRKEARALGVKRYFTGTPCQQGHVAERRVSTCTCIQCAAAYVRKTNRQLAREWEANNRDRRREYQQKSYLRNRDKVLARLHAYYQKNKEKHVLPRSAERSRKIVDLIAVLRNEMPDLLKEFGL